MALGGFEALQQVLDDRRGRAPDAPAVPLELVRRAQAPLPVEVEALQAIEVSGTPVKTFAENKGLSSSNAAVRVFRAREALKKRVSESCGTCAEHGCMNCTCRQQRHT